MFLKTIRRDLAVVFRSPAEVINPLIFFVIVITLFPLGISPSEAVLREIAPGVIWVAALLATLLSVEVMFRGDFEDGSLEQMLLNERSLVSIVGGKIASHWLMTGLPLTILSPMLALMLFVNPEGIRAIFFSLLLGTPILSLLGAIGAALTFSLRRGGVLVSILVLPLYVPLLIFATEMVKAGAAGLDYTGYFYWLAALLSLSLGFAPLAASAGVKISLSQ